MIDTIVRLKVTLDDVEPQVLRRIEVPLMIRLDRLHLALQEAMGWTNDHLYEIRAGDVGWGVPDPSWGDGPLDARKARLIDVLEDVRVKTFRYLYDFGDGWEHTIKVERLVDATPGALYPRLIDATGRCPPEDIGGPWGYGEFLEAVADPKHARHAEWSECQRAVRSRRNQHPGSCRRARNSRQKVVAQNLEQAPQDQLNRCLRPGDPTAAAFVG